MDQKPIRPDLRHEMLIQVFKELEGEPGRKRDRLYKTILQMIERGFWNPGDRLPTDWEFSQLLPLSVATVQAALKMLADQHVIVRKQKNGSFIASEENLSRDAVFFNFKHPESQRTADVSFQSFDIVESRDPSPGQSFFGTSGPLLKITRDAEVAGEFRVLSELYLADPRLRILLDLNPDMLKDLAIRPLLQIRFGLPSVRIEWQFTVCPFDGSTCARLGVPDGTIGQVADAQVYTVNDRKLMYHRMLVPPTQWALFLSA